MAHQRNLKPVRDITNQATSHQFEPRPFLPQAPPKPHIEPTASTTIGEASFEASAPHNRDIDDQNALSVPTTFGGLSNASAATPQENDGAAAFGHRFANITIHAPTLHNTAFTHAQPQRRSDRINAHPLSPVQAKFTNAPSKKQQGALPPGPSLDPTTIPAADTSQEPENTPDSHAATNKTGLPDRLKAGIEALSGFQLDKVRVHYHSARPAQLKALAYTQGGDIYVAPGQEKYLPHEAWHVVQQAQGRVRPTMHLLQRDPYSGARRSQDVPINADPSLEQEADRMGIRAAGLMTSASHSSKKPAVPLKAKTLPQADGQIVQRAVGFEYELDSSYVQSQFTEGKKKTLGIFGREESPKPMVELKKGYVIADFDTFDLSVDSTPEGFDVEIRIKEVDHISPISVNGLAATVYQVLAILKKLRSLQQPITGDKVEGNPAILLGGDFSSGSLQATAGLSLTALHAFLSGEMGHVHQHRQDVNPSETQNIKAYYTRQYGQGSALILQKAFEHVNIGFPKLPIGAKQQVAAAITSILTIPITARDNKLPYAKSATTLLARSDYATVFNALPAVVLMDKNRLKNLIMITLNTCLALQQKQQVALDSPIYPPNSIRDSAGLSLTIGAWLDGLLPTGGVKLKDSDSGSNDLLTNKNYPREELPGDDHEQLESLGGYGSKTDVGEHEQRLPIFEFRKYLKVPNDHLMEVVVGIWELIYQANKKRS